MWSALVAHQAFADDWGRQLLDESVRTAASLMAQRGDMRPFFHSVFMHLSGPAWFGTQENVKLDARLQALRAANVAQSLRRRWLPGQSTRMAAAGLEAFDKSVKLARAHHFEVKIETPEDNERAEAALKALGASVRARFAGPSAAAL